MSSTFSRMRRLLTPAERRAALMLLGLMLIGMTLETLCTGLVVPAIALLMQQDLGALYPQLRPLAALLGDATHAELILMVMLGLMAVYLVKNLFLAFLAWRQTRFAFSVQAALAQRLFTLYLRQPYTFHLQRNSAQLIRNITGEVGMFAYAIVAGLLIATELLVLAGISALLLVVEPIGTVIAAVVLGAAAWSFLRVTRARLVRWGETRQLHDGLRLQHLQQGLGGAKDVKLLGREKNFLDQFRMHNLQSARMNQLQATLQNLPRLWLELLAVAGLATLVAAMIVQGRDAATMLPTLGLFAAAAFRLLPSVNRVIASAELLRYNLPVISHLSEELRLDAPAAAAVPSRDRRATEFRSEIRLAGVSFTYPAAAAPALAGLELCIRKGECVGFIGPSGSGKSTLVDVVLGLLAPQAGQVLVDGAPIQAHLRAWQDQIGYVPQSIYLTDDSLRRNVAFGLPDHEIDEQRVRRALAAAQLEEFVAELPKGLETRLGERGVRLSGGQRQRIGIARALYHDPAVLVLDEATSALDAATEREVMQAVNALQGQKTILIVAHRLSTVQQCGRLYRLERGWIAGEETPATAGQASAATR